MVRPRTSSIRRERRPLSLVVPTWNGGARFRAQLDALARQDLAGGFELVVVDSGSTDGTWEAAASAGAHVLSIPQSEFGHGRTRNLAIAETDGERVALLTQDALPLDDSYLAHLFAALDDPAVDGAYARQFPRPDCDPLIAERLRQWSATRDTPLVQELVAGSPEASRARFEAMAPMERYQTCAFDNVASCVRRSTWERHPFPERDFGEDMAWARAVLLDGGRIAFEPKARVEHSHSLVLAREFRRIYRDHQNLVELFGLRNVPTWGDVLRGAAHQRRFYRELLARCDLARGERLYWRALSIPHAFLETAAQFLGARSHGKIESSRFWRWVDVRIQKGA